MLTKYLDKALNWLPPTRSPKWSKLLVWLAVGNAILLLLTRVILGVSITVGSVTGFLIISSIISVFLIPGYFGYSRYALGIFSGIAIGHLYMFTQVLFSADKSWTDLTSIFSFLSMVVLGIMAGLLAQILDSLITQENDKP